MSSSGKETARILLQGAVGIAIEVIVSFLLMAVSFLVGGTIRHWLLR